MNSNEPFDVKELEHRYPSYLDLLGTSLQPDDSMGAIIVPAARPPEDIATVAQLAKTTGTLLVTLCSHSAASQTIADTLDNMSVPNWWAIDMPSGYENPLVQLNAAEEIPEQTRRAIRSNLSDKRNAGLLIAKLTGMRRIMFVDDDVTLEQQTFRSASSLLAGFKVVGLRCLGFPDKAVVNHAEQHIVRYHQSTTGQGAYSAAAAHAGHISGNSVAVNPQTSCIFFPPEIYDEDLLAFYDMYAERSAALVKQGGYHQTIYDPFADPDRARTEEFGEVLTDGLYQNLKLRSHIDLTKQRFWDTVTVQRGQYIGYLLKGLEAPQKREYFTYLTELPKFDPVEKTKIRNSLLAAQAVNTTITGKMCVDYYRAWRADQGRWRKRLEDLPNNIAMRDAIGQLGLMSYSTNTK